jgi:hypothetical protein
MGDDQRSWSDRTGNLYVVDQAAGCRATGARRITSSSGKLLWRLSKSDEVDRMPKLQIHGTDVAEVDDNLAEKLKGMVSLHGIGKNQKPATFQQQVYVQPGKPRPQMKTFTTISNLN